MNLKIKATIIFIFLLVCSFFYQNTVLSETRTDHVSESNETFDEHEQDHDTIHSDHEDEGIDHANHEEETESDTHEHEVHDEDHDEHEEHQHEHLTSLCRRIRQFHTTSSFF